MNFLYTSQQESTESSNTTIEDEDVKGMIQTGILQLHSLMFN